MKFIFNGKQLQIIFSALLLLTFFNAMTCSLMKNSNSLRTRNKIKNSEKIKMDYLTYMNNKKQQEKDKVKFYIDTVKNFKF